MTNMKGGIEKGAPCSKPYGFSQWLTTPAASMKPSRFRRFDWQTTAAKLQTVFRRACCPTGTTLIVQRLKAYSGTADPARVFAKCDEQFTGDAALFRVAFSA